MRTSVTPSSHICSRNCGHRRLVERRDHVVDRVVDAARDQQVDGPDRAAPASGDAAGRVMDLRRRAVDRDVDGQARERRETVRHVLVDEPAVRVQRDRDAGGGEALDELQGQIAAQERLAAGDDRLDDPELDRLVDRLAPRVVGQVGRALERPARRVRVAEVAAQVARVGELELAAHRAVGHGLTALRVAVAGASGEPANAVVTAQAGGDGARQAHGPGALAA